VILTTKDTSTPSPSKKIAAQALLDLSQCGEDGLYLMEALPSVSSSTPTKNILCSDVSSSTSPFNVSESKVSEVNRNISTDHPSSNARKQLFASDSESPSPLRTDGNKKSEIIKILKHVGTQVKSGHLLCNFTRYIETDNDLCTLCGIQTFSILNQIVLHVTSLFPNIRVHKLSVQDRIILAFIKLKHDVSFSLLTILFRQAGRASCRQNFYDTIKKLSVALRPAIIWVPKSEILRRMPVYFKNFRNTMVILDCTEITIEQPKCLKSILQLVTSHEL
jgi:hypothetical protein